MLGYGVILVGLGIGLGTGKRSFYYAAMVLIALSVILPIFDDFGFADFFGSHSSYRDIDLFIYKRCNLLIAGDKITG